MVDVLRTSEFDEWLSDLRDRIGRAKVLVRIQRFALGNLGDVAPVGEEVSEMRIDFGPGYRVYFKQQGQAVIVLLCGGDKLTQARDIQRAKALAKNTTGW